MDDELLKLVMGEMRDFRSVVDIRLNGLGTHIDERMDGTDLKVDQLAFAIETLRADIEGPLADLTAVVDALRFRPRRKKKRKPST